MERSGTSRKARYCEIKAAPKEMDRADLADIPGAKSTKKAIDRNDSSKKPCHSIGVIGSRPPIISKRNGVGNFVRATIKLRRAAELPDQVQEARMGHRAKREACSVSIRRR